MINKTKVGEATTPNWIYHVFLRLGRPRSN